MTLRMPAEWEKQKAIWLAWPHNKNDWPGKFDAIKWVYCEIVKHLIRSVRVRLIVKNAAMQALVETYLDASHISLEKIDFVIAKTDRSWLRDSAPIFVYNGKQKTLLDWQFNAWAKYDNWKHDNKIPSIIAEQFDLPCIQPMHKHRRVVLEGGAIEVNGNGILITTEECLMSQKQQCRNKGFSKADYESIFANYLGVQNTIWLGDGIAGDDTHGHIDDLARFVNEDTIVTAVEGNKKSKNYASLQHNLNILKRAKNTNGKPFNILELPMPTPSVFEDTLLPASYANFLITNNTVLVPTFNDKNDNIALDILTRAMPKHDVIGIYCGDLILGLGTIHCASQQEIQ